MQRFGPVWLSLGLTLACGGGSDGGGSGGSAGAGGTGAAAGAGGSGGLAGAGGGSANYCGNIKFLASCKSNNGTGTCAEFYDDVLSSDGVKPLCDAQGPGTLDATAKCDVNTGFGACVIKYVDGSCRVYYWGSPQYSTASAAMDACTPPDGTWYPH